MQCLQIMQNYASFFSLLLLVLFNAQKQKKIANYAQILRMCITERFHNLYTRVKHAQFSICHHSWMAV